MNTTHPCPLCNRGIHQFCGKQATKPGQEEYEIINYYICPLCEETRGLNRIGIEEKDFEDGSLDSSLPIRVAVQKMKKVIKPKQRSHQKVRQQGRMKGNY